MPNLFLSPSTQDQNPYVTGGSEEYYMNLVADAMEPYLRANGIAFTRNNPAGTVTDSINQSNSGTYDLHLALHSNAAGAANSGQVRGTDVYYAQGSNNGQRAAFIIADNFKEIYPLPDRVRALATTRLAEVTRTNAPAVLVEIAYHDNVEDANWITENIEPIARNLSESVTTYFGLPFVEPIPVRTGTVTAGGGLNIRDYPSTEGTIIGTAPFGATLQITGRYEDWYVVNDNGLLGYANSGYIRTE